MGTQRRGMGSVVGCPWTGSPKRPDHATITHDLRRSFITSRKPKNAENSGVAVTDLRYLSDMIASRPSTYAQAIYRAIVSSALIVTASDNLTGKRRISSVYCSFSRST
jgi:hypothetical protein